jgi:hypothetical protein
MAVMTLAAGFAAMAAAAEWTGRIVDKKCSGQGRSMWINQECIASCIRDGVPAVLATEEKIYAIANQAKVPQAAYGLRVRITGNLDNGDITIEKIEVLQ